MPLLASLALGLGGCEIGEKIALKPIEKVSRFCSDGQALYRAGSVLFCTFPSQRWPSRITYAVGGPSAAAFDRQVRDVVATASCLTGRPFEAAADGDFKATIENRIVPADASGKIRHDDNTISVQSQLGLVRGGTLRVRTTNASPDIVGRDLEKGLWDFLGIRRPKPIAIAYHAFSDAKRPTKEITDGSRFCTPDNVLMQTDGVYFCAAPKHDWRDAGYALISERSGFEGVGPTVAGFAGRLAQIRIVPSKKPELLVILTEYELTKTTFPELLRKYAIEPRGPSIELAHLQHSFQDDVRKALGPLLGKPISAAMAAFMSTTESASAMTATGRAVTDVIGLHDRSDIDAENEVLKSFLDLLQVQPPAYHPPAACR